MAAKMGSHAALRVPHALGGLRLTPDMLAPMVSSRSVGLSTTSCCCCRQASFLADLSLLQGHAGCSDNIALSAKNIAVVLWCAQV